MDERDKLASLDDDDDADDDNETRLLLPFPPPSPPAVAGCGNTHPPNPLVALNSSFLQKRTGIGGGGCAGIGFRRRREELRG